MTQSIPQIKADIENTKDHLQDTVQKLEGRFEEMKDWRTVVSQYPVPCIGASVAAGLLLGSILFKPSRTVNVPAGGNVKVSGSAVGQTAGNLLATVVTGVVTAAIREQIKNRLATKR